MFSFLSIGWGLISDIDIESERLRYMGHQRFSLWSLKRLISLRTYHGKLSYIPAGPELLNPTSNHPPPTRPAISHSISYNTYLSDAGPDSPTVDADINKECGDGEILSLETGVAEKYSDAVERPRFDSFYSATSRKTAYYSLAGSDYRSVNGDVEEINHDTKCIEANKNVQMFGPSSSLPALLSPVPSDWIVEEGDYVMVHATYQTHLSSDVFFVPSSKLNDGIIWLVIIKSGVTRPQLLNFMLGLSSGTHLTDKESEHFKVIPVTAFRIEPSGDDGILTVDGERVDYGPIQGEVCPGLARVMVPERFTKPL